MSLEKYPQCTRILIQFVAREMGVSVDQVVEWFFHPSESRDGLRQVHPHGQTVGLLRAIVHRFGGSDPLALTRVYVLLEKSRIAISPTPEEPSLIRDLKNEFLHSYGSPDSEAGSFGINLVAQGIWNGVYENIIALKCKKLEPAQEPLLRIRLAGIPAFIISENIIDPEIKKTFLSALSDCPALFSDVEKLSVGFDFGKGILGLLLAAEIHMNQIENKDLIYNLCRVSTKEFDANGIEMMLMQITIIRHATIDVMTLRKLMPHAFKPRPDPTNGE